MGRQSTRMQPARRGIDDLQRATSDTAGRSQDGDVRHSTTQKGLKRNRFRRINATLAERDGWVSTRREVEPQKASSRVALKYGSVLQYGSVLLQNPLRIQRLTRDGVEAF